MKNILPITLRTADKRYNPESGEPGIAVEAINLRERDNILMPVGAPNVVATLPAGEKLLIVDTHDEVEYFITTADNSVFLYAIRTPGMFATPRTLIGTLQGEASDAYAIGDFVVIGSEAGVVYLHFKNGKYSMLSIESAIPNIILSAGEIAERVDHMPEYTFKGSYTQWNNPLIADDVKGITRIMQSAYNSLADDGKNSGRFVQPIIARYLVRLWDDSILWASAPVIIGNGIQNGDKIVFNVNQSDGGFTSIQEADMKVKSYGVAMTVMGGNAEEWDALIKSVEVYYAIPSSDIVESTITYRCETSQSGTRNYFLSASLDTGNSKEIVAELANVVEWKLLGVISNPSLLREGMAIGVGIAKSTDLTGGCLSDKTWIIYNDGIHTASITSLRFAEVTRQRGRNSVFGCHVVSGGKAHSGGGAAILCNNWDITDYMTADLAAVHIDACVILTLRSNQGKRRLVASYSSNYSALQFSPLLAFPFPDATRAEILISHNGTTYEYSAELIASDSREYAYFATPDFRPISPISTESSGYGVPLSDNIIEDRNSIFTVNRIANPFIVEKEIAVCDGAINAIAFAIRPVSANIFGKFPIYAFTSRGIYAISTDTLSSTPRCISPYIATSPTKIASSPGGIYFLSGESLFLLSGSSIKEISRNAFGDRICWCEKFGELWCTAFSRTSIYSSNGRRYSRRESVAYFCTVADQNIFAITSDGKILDISNENDCNTSIYYISHPITSKGESKQITWNIYGNELNLTATLFGDMGAGCHGGILSRVKIDGRLNAPLRIPLRAPHYRVLRLELIGTLPSTATIHPTEIKFTPR